MKRFKLGFRNRSVIEQLSICRRVCDGLAKLPQAVRAALAHIPVAATVAEAIEVHNAVETLRSELRVALRKRKLKVAAARKAVTRAALAVFVQTRGNPAGQLAAGLEIQGKRHPVGRPGAPGQLRAVPTQMEGTVRLRWKRPVRRCVFYVEMTAAANAQSGWTQVATSLRQSCEVTGLKNGVKHWFRVAATNAHGQGAWSNPVCVRAV